MSKITFFASDIHGKLPALEQLIEAFKREEASNLILLGDLLYHGPRNGLFEGYDPSACIPLFNGLADKIVAVRGNCDAEVDQAVLNFPILNDQSWLMLEGVKFFLYHGHKTDLSAVPAAQGPVVCTSGHTHLPVLEKQEGRIMFNPGSASLPKGGHPATYGLWNGETLFIKTLDGNIYRELKIL